MNTKLKLLNSKLAIVEDQIVGTTARSLAAQRFYEKHGFVEIEKDSLPAQFPVMEVDSKSL